MTNTTDINTDQCDDRENLNDQNIQVTPDGVIPTLDDSDEESVEKVTDIIEERRDPPARVRKDQPITQVRQHY